MSKKNYYLGSSEIFSLKPGENYNCSLTLEECKTKYNTIVVGRVLQGVNPLEEALILITNKESKVLYETYSDSNGIFLFKEIVPKGDYRIVASCPCYKTSEPQNVSIVENTPVKVYFNLKEDASSARGIIYGTVKEAFTGNAVVNARIYLNYKNRNIKSSDSISNSKGEYIIYNILPGEYILQAEFENYQPSPPISIKIEEKNKIPVDIILNNSPGVTGSITDVIKGPLPQESAVPVFLYELRDNKEILKEIQTTNSEGLYVFSNLGPGIYKVKANLLTQGEYEKEFTL
ncbi:MSCRAMM family protein [Clostridium polynesiense]|uniref:MSCRAMM family protein n=1 Tax=Clostridium polynesiense TaxID=1325933 RepID=UPI00058FAC54|nr:carboxypeptidase regulatory-like domain-containing protein [Clostridium polynesiense]